MATALVTLFAVSVDAHYRDVSPERKGLFKENDDIKAEWALIIQCVYIRYRIAVQTQGSIMKQKMQGPFNPFFQAKNNATPPRRSVL